MDPAEQYQAALEINPGLVGVLVQRAGLTINRATFATGDAERSDLYRSAIADLTQALETNPESADALIARGRARVNWADGLPADGRERSDLLNAAVEEGYGGALRVNPTAVETLYGRALARHHLGGDGWLGGTDPRGLFRQAQDDLDRAIAERPYGSKFWQLRGTIRLDWGRWLELHSVGAGRSKWEEAAAGLAEAIRINGREAKSWYVQGCIRLFLGEPERALADFEQALAINPRLEGKVRPRPEQARREAALRAPPEREP